MHGYHKGRYYKSFSFVVYVSKYRTESKTTFTFYKASDIFIRELFAIINHVCNVCRSTLKSYQIMFGSKTLKLKSKTGKRGEDLACKYLIGKGYRILERNYWKPWGEIDIVAVAKTNTLVFVEVKTLKESFSGLLPEDNLTSAKLSKLQRTCRQYVADKPDLIREDRGWQIDLIAVSIPIGVDEPDLKNCEIRYYQNI